MNPRQLLTLWQKTPILSLIAIAVTVLILLGCASGSTGTPPSSETLEAAVSPQPISPQGGLVFIESDIVLEWRWSPALTDTQTFAVQVWYEDEPVREVWTNDTSLNVKELIDSYSRDLGNFYWQVAVIEFSEERGFERMGSEWSPAQTLYRVRRFIPTPYPPSQQSEVAKLVVAQALSSQTEVIDYAREFVQANITGDYKQSSEPDKSDILAMMYEYSQGRGEAPHLLCDGRSGVMLNLLKELGIESRLIFLYKDSDTDIGEHTILEVFNPDTQRWEAHDPTGNFYY